MKLPPKGCIPKLVRAILGELYARMGFDHWYDRLDDEIRSEIHRELNKIVRQHIRSWKPR